MKIRIEKDPSITEDEVIIRCGKISDSILKIEHTKKDVYQTKYRLYELEELLSGSFIRVSKSTILNVSHVLSIKKNLTASSEVWFEGTHKQVYVSRNYYKQLKQRLEEKRLKR